MRTFVITFLFLTNVIFHSIAQENTFTLTVNIKVTKYDRGTIFLALYDSEANYMNKAYKGSKAAVKNGKATIIIEGLEKGSYAFSLFHDINDNTKLDKNGFGVPKEPYAFSNGKKGLFGPPDFNKVKFDISANTSISVKIK